MKMQWRTDFENLINGRDYLFTVRDKETGEISVQILTYSYWVSYLGEENIDFRGFEWDYELEEVLAFIELPEPHNE